MWNVARTFLFAHVLKKQQDFFFFFHFFSWHMGVNLKSPICVCVFACLCVFFNYSAGVYCVGTMCFMSFVLNLGSALLSESLYGK